MGAFSPSLEGLLSLSPTFSAFPPLPTIQSRDTSERGHWFTEIDPGEEANEKIIEKQDLKLDAIFFHSY